MSNTSKYSGLAGTILLGTLLGLNSTQYGRRKNPLADKAGTYDPENETKPGTFFDKDGNLVPLGKTDLPGTSAVRTIRGVIPSASPLILCGTLSVLWAVRSFGAMNKVLNRRYNDIVYQIRRPDVIANRVVAWRYLGIGGMIVPGIFGIGFLWISRNGLSEAVSTEMSDIPNQLSIFGDRLRVNGVTSPLSIRRGDLASSVAEFSKTLRDGFRPF
jgi:hypothetical protein